LPLVLRCKGTKIIANTQEKSNNFTKKIDKYLSHSTNSTKNEQITHIQRTKPSSYSTTFITFAAFEKKQNLKK
jgi:hypothetical protein